MRLYSSAGKGLELSGSLERPMKNIAEVLQAKEEDILRVKKEIEALRLIAPLLGEEEERANGNGRVFGPQPVRETP